ncbi:YcnI family protein [Agromyces salentinus]|uniref:YncI copper-binding domain-containing protein n=1 Tax=Agromyces salentinus TaxID=269421 RepID=A0ABP4YUE3_9MICO|nr:YcnI family protein [Agromyces salentinus]
MNFRTPRVRTLAMTTTALVGGAVLALAAPLAASAHVTVTPSDTAAGSYSVLTFAFGHGCEASPTTQLTFEMPEEIESVSPTLNPNWTIEKVAEGDRTSQVVYTAVTPVADGYRDTIALQVHLPEDAAGTTLEFPVLQTCETGETNWNEPTVEGEAEPEHPAPAITVTEDAADGHGHGASTEDADAAKDEHGAAEAATDSSDTVARVLGIGGLAVGVVGIVLALAARRPRKDA